MLYFSYIFIVHVSFLCWFEHVSNNNLENPNGGRTNGGTVFDAIIFWGFYFFVFQCRISGKRDSCWEGSCNPLIELTRSPDKLGAPEDVLTSEILAGISSLDQLQSRVCDIGIDALMPWGRIRVCGTSAGKGECMGAKSQFPFRIGRFWKDSGFSPESFSGETIKCNTCKFEGESEL